MRNLFLLFVCFLSFYASHAQDLIVLDENKKLDVRIIRFSEDKVYYRDRISPANIEFEVNLAQVQAIKFEGKPLLPTDSAVALFATPQITTADSSFYNTTYEQGKYHARQFYNGRGPQIITFVTSAGAPPVGLVSAIIFSNSKPNEMNMLAPDYEMFKDNNYRMGYLHEAKKIRRKKAWVSFAVGTLLFGVTYGIIQNR